MGHGILIIRHFSIIGPIVLRLLDHSGTLELILVGLMFKEGTHEQDTRVTTRTMQDLLEEPNTSIRRVRG